MVEEKTEKTISSEDSGSGKAGPESSPETTPPIPPPRDLISEANTAAERMEKANAELERLLIKQEALKVEHTLSGTANAGKQTISKEEKEIAEAKKMLAGTGYEDILDKPKK